LILIYINLFMNFFYKLVVTFKYQKLINLNYNYNKKIFKMLKFNKLYIFNYYNNLRNNYKIYKF
jgi:hypothetical protein